MSVKTLVVGRDADPANRDSRSQPQPGNLKERIAALEQRNALSSADRPSSPSVPLATGSVSNSTRLRDKIAKFERKGGVPVPRGSFGLGAPPLAENAPLKRRGELYGNRIPGVRAVSGMTGGYAGSSIDAGRVVSMPNLDGVSHGEMDGEYLPSTSSPSPQFTGLTPQHTGTIGTITPQTTGSALTPQSTGNRESARATSFVTALELARKVEAESQAEAPLRPVAIPHTDLTAATTNDLEENSAGAASAPPSIVPENQEKLDTAPAQPQVSSPPEASDEPAPAAKPDNPSTPSIVLSPSDEQANPLVISVLEESTKTNVEDSRGEPIETTAPALPTPTSLVVPPAPETPPTEPKTHVEPENDKSPSITLSPAESTPSQSTTNQSPLGPFSLANAVHDLGKVVANIQDMFPGQISPLAAPPSCRPLVIDTPSTSKEPITLTDTKKSIPDLQLKLEISSGVSPSESRQMVPATSSVTKPTELLTSPRSVNARPVSMFAASPNNAASHMASTPSRDALLVGPKKSGVPVNKYEHFPPTPEPQVSEFGTTPKGHKFSHSLSHTPSSTEQSTNTGSFSAVVHKKVTETPSTATATSSSYLSIYAKVSEAPKKSSEPEPLVSPGYGELAALLHEAALLEFSLEHGELPSDGSKKAGLEQNDTRAEKEEEEEKEKSAAAKVAVEEEKKEHANVTKAQAKQVSESESKSTLRNPLLRSKSAQKRDESADSERRKEPIRSKSVVLPSRSLPEPPSLQNTPLTITSILEKEAAHTVDAALEAETKSPTQTSPRSLRYFTSLKRFASSSKTSLTSNSQSRDSVSAPSEISSEDWSVIPTSAGNCGEVESKGGLFNGTGIGWPVLSPKKSPGVGRSASFTDRIFNRNRKTSKTSEVSSVSDTNSPYEAIDRLAKSKTGRSAGSFLPPLDPVSFTLNVPVIQENDQVLPSPPELVSPRRSASLDVPSTSQFPPVLSARPTSSFYTSIPQISEKSTSSWALDSVDEDKLASPNFTSLTETPQQSIDAIFSAKPISPVYTPRLSSSPDAVVPTQTPSMNTTYKPHNLDAALFSVKPTSPVYTPHASAFAMRSEETITDSPLLPGPEKEAESPSSWMSNVSVDSFASSIPSPFFDSFPSVPQQLPLSPALPGRQRNFNKPSLPLPTASSFFESAPALSSAAVGAEFLGGSSPFVKSTPMKSATFPQTSGEHYRS